MEERRIIAVDWSGAKKGASRKIWLAEVENGKVTRLEPGRTRGQVIEYLIGLARQAPNLIVGLDFAFSFAAWFVREKKAATAEEFWTLVSKDGEFWLKDCCAPFWGRKGRMCDKSRCLLRQTEMQVAVVRGIRPKSVFQIGGAGAVGTGSIRGMPFLKLLKKAGFKIWPFDPAIPPLVIEIYPRALTGAVNKTDAKARSEYLEEHFPALDPEHGAKARSSDDAFDALVSGLTMARHHGSFACLEQATDPEILLEGSIWTPPTVLREGGNLPRGTQ